MLATDIDADAAARTAEQVGGFSAQLDVRDPEAHRAAARRGARARPARGVGQQRRRAAHAQGVGARRRRGAAAGRGQRTGRDVGLARGGRRDATSAAARTCTSSTSPRCPSLAPVPGLAVYAATKHAVLGFTASLQGDLHGGRLADHRARRLSRRRGHGHDARAGHRAGFGDHLVGAAHAHARRRSRSAVVGLLDSKRMVLVIPRWRGWVARGTALAGRHGLRTARAAAPPRRAQARARLGLAHSDGGERMPEVSEATAQPRHRATVPRPRGSRSRTRPPGRVVASVDVVPAERHRGAGRSRPRGAAGLGGARVRGSRRRCFRRCQKWVIDNTDRIIETIVSETGKAWEDAQMAEVSYVAGAFGFWAKNAEKYLADEQVRTASPFVQGPQADRALRAGRRGRGDRPLELPAHQLVRRLHPGHGGRQRRDPQAERGHPAVRRC